VANVRAHVWHSADGTIHAVGRPTSAYEGRVEPLGTEDLTAISVEVEESQLAHLVRTHRIDPARGTLIARDR